VSRALETMREINDRYHAATRDHTLCDDCQRVWPGEPMRGIRCPGPAMIDGRDAREVCACGCHDW
jgi:hypothetical protein